MAREACGCILDGGNTACIDECSRTYEGINDAAYSMCITGCNQQPNECLNACAGLDTQNQNICQGICDTCVGDCGNDQSCKDDCYANAP